MVIVSNKKAAVPFVREDKAMTCVSAHDDENGGDDDDDDDDDGVDVAPAA